MVILEAEGSQMTEEHPYRYQIVMSETTTLLTKIFGHCHNRGPTRLCPACEACDVPKWSLLQFVEGTNEYGF